MPQSAVATGDNNRIIQILGDHNSVNNSVPRLTLDLSSGDTQRAQNDFLYSLYPRARSTTFVGRQREMSLIDAFLDSDPPVSFMVLTGEGGSGKTRLALEICHARAERGWHAGFASGSALPAFIEACLAYSNWSHTADMLIVVDYAAVLADNLRKWLDWLSVTPPTQHRLRILLVERTAHRDGGWLQAVLGTAGERSDARAQLQYPASPCALLPLESPQDRLSLMQDVLNQHGHTTSAWQQNEAYVQQIMETTWGGIPLFLMMTAHNMLESDGRVLSLTREELTLRFAEREAQRIQEQAHAKALHEKFLQELVACVTLAQGMSEEQIEAWTETQFTAQHISKGSLHDYVRLLFELLPSSVDNTQDRLPPLRPDVIGEAYILHVFKKHRSVLFDCLKQFGTPVLETLLRLAHDFGRAETTPLDWLKTALEKIENLEALAKLYALIPYPSVPLRAFELSVTEKLLSVWKQQKSPEEQVTSEAELAGLLNSYAISLSEMGQRKEALNVAQESVNIRRQLNSANTAFRPNFAGSLNNLAIILSGDGQPKEALLLAREAADIYRQLSADNAAAFLPDLALLLNNLANRLSENGQRKEALEAAREAADIRRELSATNATAFRPDLALSLNTLANRLSENGQRKEALEAAREAADIRRELSATNAAAFRPDLALSLNTLANRLSENGQRKEALEAAWEATEIYSHLSADNVAVFLPDLAMSLNNLAIMLSEGGQCKKALEAAREAADIYRQLSADNAAAFRPDRALSLNNQALMLSGDGQRKEALEAAREAADIYRECYAVYPDSFSPYIKISLGTLIRCLLAMDLHAEAAAVQEELDSITNK